jgi:hypothetical protein
VKHFVRSSLCVVPVPVHVPSTVSTCVVQRTYREESSPTLQSKHRRKHQPPSNSSRLFRFYGTNKSTGRGGHYKKYDTSTRRAIKRNGADHHQSPITNFTYLDLSLFSSLYPVVLQGNSFIHLNIAFTCCFCWNKKTTYPYSLPLSVSRRDCRHTTFLYLEVR